MLLIDDKRGDLLPIPAWSLAYVLAGTLLMDLALEGRIDTDPDYLSLLDETPTRPAASTPLCPPFGGGYNGFPLC